LASTRARHTAPRDPSVVTIALASGSFDAIATIAASKPSDVGVGILRVISAGAHVVAHREQRGEVVPEPFALHEHRDSARFRHLGHLDGHLGEPAVEVAQRRAVEEAVDGGGGHLFRGELGPRGVNAGPRRSLAIDDDVRERGALTGLDDDVRGVHAVVAELVQDGFPGAVVGELGEDGGSAGRAWRPR
jgi:hypothetical protein